MQAQHWPMLFQAVMPPPDGVMLSYLAAMQDYDYRLDRSSCPSRSPIGRSVSAAIHARRRLVSAGLSNSAGVPGRDWQKRQCGAALLELVQGLVEGSKSARWVPRPRWLAIVDYYK